MLHVLCKGDLQRYRFESGWGVEDSGIEMSTENPVPAPHFV